MSKAHQTLPALRTALQAAGYKISEGKATFTPSNVDWYAYREYDEVKGFFDVCNPYKGPQVVLVPYDLSQYNRDIPPSIELKVQWSSYMHNGGATYSTRVSRDIDDLSIDSINRHCNELASIAVAIQQLN